MAITGTGTQADPYVVTTWDELVAKAAESGKYVKLGNNIDMNDEYPEGITTYCTLNCTELDGDGKIIKNLSINGVSCVFKAGSSNMDVKNIKIENLYFISTSGSKYFIDNSTKKATFTQLSVSGRFSAPQQGSLVCIFKGDTNFYRCAFNLHTQGRFRNNEENNLFKLHYCNININGEGTGKIYFVFDNTYVTGSLSGIDSVFAVQGSSVGVIDMACPAVTGDYDVPLVLANSDKCSSIYRARAVTTAQLTDAEYLSSIGFPIQT